MYEAGNLNYLTKDKSLGERKKKTRMKIRHRAKLSKHLKGFKKPADNRLANGLVIDCGSSKCYICHPHKLGKIEKNKILSLNKEHQHDIKESLVMMEAGELEETGELEEIT